MATPDVRNGRGDVSTNLTSIEPVDAGVDVAVEVDRDDGRTGSWRSSVLAVLPAWITARAIVLLSLAFARYLVDHLHVTAPRAVRTVHAGLFAWDAAWYTDIARSGYEGVARQGLRFFPIVPLVTRGLASIGFGTKPALLIVANVSAFVAAVLLYRLAWFEKRDGALARRAVWLLAIAPPAFVFVMGYADATAIALAIGAFFALRRRRWGWAALAALFLGACRPTGCLLAVPAAIEAARGFSTTTWWERVQRGVAVVAAPAGMMAYLGWVGARFGDVLLPFRVQQNPRLHGRFTNPFSTIRDAIDGAWHGHIGTALHVPWLVVLIALAVVLLLRWPAAYGAFALVTLAASSSSSNLDSLERYALGAFAFVLIGAALTDSPRVEQVVFTLSGVGLFAYSTLAFVGRLTP